MWELDCKEGWAGKNWCFWTVVLEKTLESPLDCREIQPVHSEEDQPWDFFGRSDAKAEIPVLWPRHTKSCLIGKDSDAGRDWGRRRRGRQRIFSFYFVMYLGNVCISVPQKFLNLLEKSYTNWSVISEQSQSKSQQAFLTLWVLKFIWKCNGPRIAKLTF